MPGFDQSFNGNVDVFVVKLAPNGMSLVYGSYIGGSDLEQSSHIAVDSTGAAYVAGITRSTETSFPSGGGFAALGVPGYDQTYNGNQDAFVLKLAPERHDPARRDLPWR